MPRAGRFRERAVIERDTGTGTDAYGQPAESWQVVGRPWAHFRETLGKEAIEAGRLEGTATGTLRLRYSAFSAGIGSADRVRIRGRLWNIRGQAIQIDNRNRVIELRVEAGVASGAAVQAATASTFPMTLPFTLA